MNNCRVCKASIAGLGWVWDKASQQQATGQPASGESRTTHPQLREDIDLETPIELSIDPEARSEHRGQLKTVLPSAQGCEECLKTGDRWVHLRICMTCGFVGCCDSSPNKHATAHFHVTGHPIMRSIEPGEDWGWSYVDKEML